MAKNKQALGEVINAEGFVTGHQAGDLVIHNGFPGIVRKTIIGTDEDAVTVDGRPIEGMKGDGKGPIDVIGVHKLIDENPTPLSMGDLVSRNTPSSVIADTSSNRAGHVWKGRYTEGTINYVDIKLLGRPSL